MKTSKIPMGLAVGLVLALLNVNKCEKPTFLGELDFLCFRSYLNNFKIDLLVDTIHGTLRI